MNESNPLVSSCTTIMARSPAGSYSGLDDEDAVIAGGGAHYGTFQPPGKAEKSCGRGSIPAAEDGENLFS